jgi:single-stranded-DNA-specific exonuclease
VHRRWFVNRTNPEYIKYLSEAASVSPVLAQILINRGIRTSGEISSFLNPRVSQLSDPFEIQDMNVAVNRILAASKNGEKVLVHGDYDADGLTAAAITLTSLKMLGIDCCSFIPNRIEHGYGFSRSSLKKAKQAGAGLIITVDCGVSSFETASLCRKQGIEVIITDHHEPVKTGKPGTGTKRSGEKQIHDPRSTTQEFLLPEAIAVINPKISNPGSGTSNLSGAGIAFKLAHALALSAGHDFQSMVHDLLDLAALGTMADVVPLTGENRVIVKEGLNLIKKGTRCGLQALKEVSGINGKAMKPGNILFTIVPRINAAGRISDSNNILDLLLTDSGDEASEISLWLDKLNSERQQIEEKVYQEALSMLGDKEVGPVIVLSSGGWHRGVIGIVASRIAEQFCRPTCILSEEGPVARGSARSIPSFDICKALAGCKELLTAFGGHKQAAGLELEARNIFPFEECMKKIADEMLAERDFFPSLEIDADVDFSVINFHLTGEMEKLEPFGFGNPEPVLGSRGLEVLYPRILKDRHLKMKLRQKNRSLDAIGFDMAPLFEKLDLSSTVDAAYTPLINEWQGARRLQMNLKAIRPSA